jgi:hypothetical protein
MKLAQTNLQSSRRDSLKIARRFNAGIGSHCVSSPAGTAERARQFGDDSVSKLVGRASSRADVRQTVLAAREDARPTILRHDRPFLSSLWDSVHFAAQPGVETPGYCRPSLQDKISAEDCRNSKPRGISGVRFHPEGMGEISRGLSESDTPGEPVDDTTLKGWQNLYPRIARTHPGCRIFLDAFRGCRVAQPPANFWQPFRLLQTAHVRDAARN